MTFIFKIFINQLQILCHIKLTKQLKVNKELYLAIFNKQHFQVSSFGVC